MSTVRRGTILKIRGRAADPASYGKEGRTRCLIFATSYKTRQVKYICVVHALTMCVYCGVKLGKLKSLNVAQVHEDEL